jgi:asparagine synthase (glutamine-hydrolysing)
MDFNNRLIHKAAWIEPLLIKKIINDKSVIKIEDYISDAMGKCTYKDNFYKNMYFNFKISLPDDMLTKVDRMSMAYSLETRIPFLDIRLIEFMVNVHKTVKMEGYQRKSILRKTFGKKLPNEILKAKKRGFVTPLREWFKESEHKNLLSELCNADIGLNNIVIKQIVNDNNQRKFDYGNFIWMLLVYKNWLNKF